MRNGIKAGNGRLEDIFGPYESGVGPFSLRGLNTQASEDLRAGAGQLSVTSRNYLCAHIYLPFSHVSFLHGSLIPALL